MLSQMPIKSSPMCAMTRKLPSKPQSEIALEQTHPAVCLYSQDRVQVRHLELGVLLLSASPQLLARRALVQRRHLANPEELLHLGHLRSVKPHLHLVSLPLPSLTSVARLRTAEVSLPSLDQGHPHSQPLRPLAPLGQSLDSRRSAAPRVVQSQLNQHSVL